MWLKFLLFAMTGGLVYKQLFEAEVQKRGMLHWTVVIISSVALLYLGADLIYHFVTHDPEKIGFARYLVEKSGLAQFKQERANCDGLRAHTPKEAAVCAAIREVNEDRLSYEKAIALNTSAAFNEYIRTCNLCKHKATALLAYKEAVGKEESLADSNSFVQAETAFTQASLEQYVQTCKRCESLALARIYLRTISIARTKLLSRAVSAESMKFSKVGRFVVSGSYAVEIENGLIWRRCAMGQRMNSGKCEGEPELLDLEQAERTASKFSEDGIDGWRAARGPELTRLIDAERGNSSTKSPFIDLRVFPSLARDNWGIHVFLGRSSPKCDLVNYDSGKSEYSACILRWPLLLVKDPE